MSSYIRDERILEACPACGSGRICCVIGQDMDFCIACKLVWERLRAGDPYTVDGEQLAFKTPCDNCAFRGGSAERKDPEGWNHLQQMLAGGGAFYCHKGVPFNVMNEEGTGPVHSEDRAFIFPRKEGKVDLAGTCHPYQHYDTARMRLCRGYLNAHIAPIWKQVFADEMS